MPPQKIRLHNSTGKHKTIKTTRPQPVPSTSSQSTNQDSDTQAELELCWCIQQLETNLNSGKLNEKQSSDCSKHINILKSNTQPIIKKRQLMRSLFGDYRAKMADEDRKMYQNNKNISFLAQPHASKKSYFVKKSALLTLGKDDNFKFEFNVPPADDIENRLTGLNISEVQIKNQESIDNNLAPINLTKESFGGNSFRFNFNIENDENK